MQNNINYYDPIDNLKEDNLPLTPSEIQLVNTLFKTEPVFMVLFREFKDAILIASLFVLMNIPQIDMLIYKFVPSSIKSIYILIGTKAIILIFLYWLLKNINFKR